MNEISNVMDAITKPTAPPNRWMASMNQACSRLQEQLDTLRERFNHLAQTDLKARARELTEQHADDSYRDALGRYQATKQTVQNANVLTRKRLQRKQAEARKLLKKEHARLMITPAIVQALAIAKQDNDERAKLTPAIQRLHDAIQIIKVHLHDLERGRGQDPEIEFRKAWDCRKLQPLPLWQQEVLAPVFEAEEQAKREQEQAQLRAKNEQFQREKEQRLQREALAYQRAEQLREKLDVCQDEAEQAMLQCDIAYYQSLADGHDEQEAQEARELANSPRWQPRPF
jgi:hypothetical protein